MLKPQTNALLGIDTGGTFTDFVLLREGQLRVHKVPSNPSAPDQAIWQGIHDMNIEQLVQSGEVSIIHGTTVATNAVLEQKGVRTAYITNRGFADVLHIGRQTRPELYNLTPAPIPAPMDPALSLEVSARIDARGREISALTESELVSLKSRLASLDVDAVAINLLFSFLDPSHEIAIQNELQDLLFVSRSSEIMPSYGEFERGITTWVNAWIGPLIARYLTQLKRALSPSYLAIMQSSAMTISAQMASKRAVNLLLSGPAGGLSCARLIGSLIKQDRLMSFDMGGTSTDVSLLEGELKLAGQGRIGGFPIGIPMADIHTIGAGGGSIAWLDDGGLLNVGPESAGAAPGPACYGKGGARPTVTDANALLGRLSPTAFFGGQMVLDVSAARRAFQPIAAGLGISVEAVAQGVLDIANEHMTQALRVISIERGHDPREFSLVCFGGAGGLHFCELAEALEMTRAIIPVHAGVLSALGMLATLPGREMVRTHQMILAHGAQDQLNQMLDELESEAVREVQAETSVPLESSRSLDLRYQGQTFTLRIPFRNVAQSLSDFESEHAKRYGHRLDYPVELVNLRIHTEALGAALELPRMTDRPGLSVDRPTPRQASLPGIGEVVSIIARQDLGPGDRLSGPALITEDHATALIKSGWRAEVDEFGNLLLEKT